MSDLAEGVLIVVVAAANGGGESRVVVVVDVAGEGSASVAPPRELSLESVGCMASTPTSHRELYGACYSGHG